MTKTIRLATPIVLCLAAAEASFTGCVGDEPTTTNDAGSDGGKDVATQDSSGFDAATNDTMSSLDTAGDLVTSDAFSGNDATTDATGDDVTTTDVQTSDVVANDVVTNDVVTHDVVGQDSSAEVGPPTWTPASLGTGLVVWLDGSQGVTAGTSGVMTWSDLSGNGNDASRGACTAAPSYGAHVAPNSHGAVGFAGSSQCLEIADASSLQWGTTDFTVEAVLAYGNASSQSEYGGYAGVWEKASGTQPFPGIGLTANGVYPKIQSSVAAALEASGWVSDPQNVAVEGATTGIDNSTYHILGVRRIGASTTLEVRLDGATDGKITTVDSVDVTSLGVPVSIGGRPNGQHALQGYIAEIVAYHGTITNLQLAQLEVYLAQKYSLP
jgi:hypothetical protein